MKELKLTKGKYALVDDEDFEKLNNYSWHILRNGYAMARIKGTNKKILLHRLILNAPNGRMIDHINHNVLDNRKENLRFCSVTENARNSKLCSKNTSGYKGVSWRANRNRWLAEIRIDGALKRLGHFIDKKEAAVAYNLAAQKYFGEFAYLNYI